MPQQQRQNVFPSWNRYLEQVLDSLSLIADQNACDAGFLPPSDYRPTMKEEEAIEGVFHEKIASFLAV